MLLCVFCSCPVVGCQRSGVGFDCWMKLSVVYICYWLSGVGCRLLTINCQVSVPMVAVASWLSCVSCQVLVVDYRWWLSLTFLLWVPSSAFPFSMIIFAAARERKWCAIPWCARPLTARIPSSFRSARKKKTIQPVITTPCRNLNCTPAVRSSAICLRKMPAFSGRTFWKFLRLPLKR